MQLNTPFTLLTLNAATAPSDETWFLQAGLERRWISAGKTNIISEYRQDAAGSNLGTTVTIGGAGGFPCGADADFWALRAIPARDAAAISVYAVYRHAEGEITSSTGASAKLDDFDMVTAGLKMDF